MHTPDAELPILRERVHTELQQARRPLTARQLADRLLPPGHETGHRQTMRALKELEATGHVQREYGTRPRGGGHYLWRATSAR
jgi:predicted transcriptional regulator